VYAVEFAGTDDALAAAEAATAAVDVSVFGPGVATARTVDERRFRGLALSWRACELLARADADVAAAATALDAAPLSRSGSVAVRARDVRGSADVSTADAERDLGGVLVDRGFEVDLDDPDHVLRALFAGDGCLLGWDAVAAVRDFAARAPTDRPFFQPGSMAPELARVMANLAGAGPGTTLLDPMCGTGGGLLESGLLGADVLGVDAQWKMVRGARENLAHYLAGEGPLGAPGDWAVARGDATRLPLPDGGVDAAVFDVPYERQSTVAGGRSAADLTAAALAEARRVAGRAVVVADRSLADPAADAGWSVEDVFERPVHRSLTRHVHVLA
jgi:tRNA (guanine10-N2)-dimethyltransferase